MTSSSPAPSSAPLIETERLRLRGHRVTDFDACLAMWTDPLVVRYIGGRAFTGEEVWTRLLRYVGHWSWVGYGYWAVEDKSGHFLGDVGFADFKREIEPSIQGIPELGWVLTSGAHGKGYATEAVRAAIGWAAAHCRSDKTVCIIHPDNLASLRVAEKCGFREDVRTTYKGSPTILFSRPLR
ncbi:MAG TPA: GNAT family N-acetyltransferase [Bryobacteraceae bacterium]|nr:GNAT family N-acetyltransferase [Bryobacteraceae bacterium]